MFRPGLLAISLLLSGVLIKENDSSSISGGTCKTPLNNDGDCIHVQQCESLKQLYALGLNQKYIKDSQCSNKRDGFKVCCPRENHVTVVPVPKPNLPDKNYKSLVERTCKTPFNKDGNCIDVLKCESLKYSYGFNINPYVKKIIDESRCSDNPEVFEVCCPQTNAPVVPPVPTPAPTSDGTIPVKPCKTPNNAVGNCINIMICESLADLYLSNSSNPEVQKILRESRCSKKLDGFEVCCPEVNYPAPLPPPNLEKCGISMKSDEVFSTRIKDGQDAIHGHWPWMAALFYQQPRIQYLRQGCGGSLISNKFVLTAAHCILGDGGYYQRLVELRLGDLDLDSTVKDGANPITLKVSARDAIMHPNFTLYPHRQHDIALIRLPTSVEFTEYIRPVCLRSGDMYKRDDYYYKMRPIVTGWGYLSSYNNRTSKLQEVSMNIVDPPECQRKYENTFGGRIDQYVLCAAEGGKDSCPGDSGSPLLIPETKEDLTLFYLAGIVSYGGRKCGEHLPGVYVRVAQYIDWINKVTGEKY